MEAVAIITVKTKINSSKALWKCLGRAFALAVMSARARSTSTSRALKLYFSRGEDEVELGLRGRASTGFVWTPEKSTRTDALD